MGVYRVDQLKGKINKGQGIARTNNFLVQLPILDYSSFNGLPQTEELNLLCTQVTLPGRQILTNERNIGLVREKVAYGYTHDDVTMTFLVLNNYGVKEYFEAWQNLTIKRNGFDGRKEIGYASDYGKDVRIKQLKKGYALPLFNQQLPTATLPSIIKNMLPSISLGNFGSIDLAQGEIDLDFILNDSVVYECRLVGAFPTTLNAIELNNDLDGFVQLTIQLSYREWESSANSSFGKSIIKSGLEAIAN